MSHAARIALLLGLLPMPAVAGNLLVNPGFEGDLSGWSQPFGNLVVWNELDYGESGDSGSALIINDTDPSGGGVPVALRQCVPVESGRRYLYGMQNYIPSGQAPNSAGYLIVDAHAGSDCLGTPVTSHFIGQFNDLNWHHADGALATDVGVQSLRLSLGVLKPAGVSAVVQAFFDDIYLLDDQLFGNGFELPP